MPRATHNLTTTINVRRLAATLNVTVQGSVMEVDGGLAITLGACTNAATGENVSLTSYERSIAEGQLSNAVEQSWADVALAQLLAQAKRLVDDRYASLHPADARAAAAARRTDGTELARMLLALDQNIRNRTFPAPKSWTQVRRDRADAIAQAAPQAFEMLFRMADTVRTLKGAHYESLATEALGLASRVGAERPRRERN